MYEELRKHVCQANIELQRHKLVIYNWGNVSGIDRKAGVVIIKPSGVACDQLTPEKLVALDLEGNVVEGSLNPSSDTPTHLELYRNLEAIGGISHTHSTYATMFAQSCCEIPCLGTTHADHFYGPVPVTESMTAEEINTDYELNTGRVIVRYFKQKQIDPAQIRAVLVACHGPFTWGACPAEAVEASVILEQIAQMALGTVSINPHQKAISQVLLDKHYLRKHGKDSYYGQKRPQDN